MIRIALLSVIVVAFLTPIASAEPISVRLEDHVFGFDAPDAAIYDYAGTDSDRLYLPASEGSYVNSYSYTGALPTIDQTHPVPLTDGSYPVFQERTNGSDVFGGQLEMDLQFDTNTGPYTNSSGDTIDIALESTGTVENPVGIVRINGWIGDNEFPFGKMHDTPTPNITLMEIRLTKVSMISRVNSDSAAMVEGIGQVTTLLGQEVTAASTIPQEAGIFFNINRTDGQPLFDANYNPADNILNQVDLQKLQGYMGVVPEPTTLAVLLVGGAIVVEKTRRKRKQ